MKFARLASRLAVGGVSAALATAGLVGVTATTASAAPVSSTYTCTPPIGSPFSVPISVDLALLPTTGAAGFPIPAGLLAFPTTATVSAAVQTGPGGLDSLGVTGARSADFGAQFGDKFVPAPAKWTKPTTADGSGNWVYTGTGSNGAFILPQAGTYTVTMPKSFTFIGTNSSGADTLAKATCTTATPATVGTIVLSKQNSFTKAKGPKSAKKGSVVTLKVKVSNDHSKEGGVVPSGKLIVKDGKKKVGKGKLKNGKAKIKVKGLAAGSHSLTVIYKGDSYDVGSKSKARKLTVK